MVHVRVWEAYIHFVFIYTEDNIFPVLSIKDLINKDGDPTMQFKLATGTKSLFIRSLIDSTGKILSSV